ncbi:hypothetical protein HYPSUDRAFT_220025 [Hypholoma sublateritium FD-334 SS-4]|uniref:Uncharacterized protein n=1 Tax=Hypholoma sublateritium (strain FD-334 SS-4) TaxID=945553 RepID=A0A0D2KLG4_HYPSF|nr:hypothetical protein HYPSUDRAFT_220025 [Hypholoma sublateritium FD-334 SS-4]
MCQWPWAPHINLPPNSTGRLLNWPLYHSFSSIMAAAVSEAPTHSNELWMRESDDETQPFLQPTSADSKPESIIAPVDLGPTPYGLGPIQLTPDDGERAPIRSRWSINNLLEEIPAEHRTILSDVGRGCVMVLTTPIAFAGVALYACGVVIEGIALVLKGVGSYGGMFLIRRRRAAPASPRAAQSWA